MFVCMSIVYLIITHVIHDYMDDVPFASDGSVTWLATNMFDITYQYDDEY